MTFDQFNLHDDLLAGVDAMNYRQATPIQEQAIPIILSGQDLIACAQTGTGKTAAYMIPLLDRISHANHDHTSTLILVPTRELAKQIDDQIEGFAYFVSATSIAIYGGGKGQDWDQQKQALTTGADIIIATPGRLIAHMQMGYVKFDKLDYLVLDEADKMLDMGFADDILNIVGHLPAQRQTLLFSATMPNKIRDFAQRILNQPAEVRLAVSKPAEGIDQQFYMAYDRQKLPLLMHLMEQQPVHSMILFTSRKSEVGTIVRELNKRGYAARGISSDLEQADREVVMRDFRNRQFPILVATDVLSRGIDVDNISHVVNYDIPRDAEDYVHRIGRTARAEQKGIAITFINEMDQHRITRIEKLLERELPKQSITEELDMGKAPIFDPKRFGQSRPGQSGGRSGSGHGGRSENGRSGRPERSGGRDRDRQRGGRRPEGSPQATATDAPNAARPNVAPTDNVAAPVLNGTSPNGATAPADTADRSDKPKRRKKRRRGPRPEGGPREGAPAQPAATPEA